MVLPQICMLKPHLYSGFMHDPFWISVKKLGTYVTDFNDGIFINDLFYHVIANAIVFSIGLSERVMAHHEVLLGPLKGLRPDVFKPAFIALSFSGLMSFCLILCPYRN